jgi:hypothetical protein
MQFRLAPVFVSKKIKIGLKQELNIPALAIQIGYLLSKSFIIRK